MGGGLPFRATLTWDRTRSRLLGVPLECGHPAQDGRASPHATLRFDVGGHAALLCYSRPSARARKIFGDVVPYGELWRTGANEPTVIHLPFAADVAGLSVAKGSYSLYTVPDPDRWLLVVNRSTRQWGLTRPERGAKGQLFASAYTEMVRRAEVGRMPIETRRIPHVEQLTARAETGADATVPLFEWETTQARVPLRAA